MLYLSGDIRRLGRVDHGSAFLDNFALERERGITIFSKQAVLSLPEMQATVLDTPGHVDFSPEMERTLDVLDCAILVVSAPAGVQSHTLTVWRLLRQRRIPTFLFINKMDQPGADRSVVLQELQKCFGDGFIDMQQPDYEAAALCDESLLDEFLETNTISFSSLSQAVYRNKIFPCWFGSALKLEGVGEFLQGLQEIAPESPDMGPFSAKVFKISRDEQGVRMSHLKVTGGILRVRDTLSGSDWEEKVTQLRVYSGAKYKTVDSAAAGQVVAAVGLSRTAPGMALGAQPQSAGFRLEPVLTYGVILPAGYDAYRALTFFRQLEDEEPQLHVAWNERAQEISVRLMGPVQLEILQDMLRTRFGLEVGFGPGSILYRETIAEPVEGVGHYEPLMHYAEVHLLMEPAGRGSGLHLASACPEDELDRNWQRLILTHLREKQHLGVLTGSPITDMTITLMSGRAHQKHTEGGDFRQATYRAVRQGLMSARSILLEPWYDFRLELPQANVGRAMTDLQRMGTKFSSPEIDGDTSILTGSASVSAIRDYPQEVTAYTRGLGHLSLNFRGYEPCPDQEAVVKEFGYDPRADTENTPDSVFCDHGASVNVSWDEVPKHMHLPSVLEPEPPEPPTQEMAGRYISTLASDKELMRIFERTYGPIRRERVTAMHTPRARTQERQARPYKGAARDSGPEYVLVDGYNIIFAWDELKKLAETSLDLARSRLIDRLRNYQGFRRCHVILVFDAYKVKGGVGSVESWGDFSIVYTREAETADMYIEKVTSQLGKNHKVRVATSDGLEQLIILSHGALRISASNFEKEVCMVEEAIRDFLRNQNA